MKLRRQTVRLISALIVLALGGLVLLQYHFLRNAIELKEQAFERNVSTALNSIVQRLERRETVGNVFRIAVNAPPDNRPVRVLSLTTEAHDIMMPDDSLHLIADFNWSEPPLRMEGNIITYAVPAPQHVSVRVFDLEGSRDTILVDSFLEAGEYTATLDRRFQLGEFVIKFFTDSSSYTAQLRNGRAEGTIPDRIAFHKRREFIGRVMEDLVVNERAAIGRRIRPPLLDSLVRISLAETGIDLPFAYGVISERNDSLQMLQPASFAHEVLASKFKTRLFPNDLLFSRNLLALYFPDRFVYLLRQIGPLLAVTALLMGIIVVCFAYTVRILVREKEFSTRLVDFINNMTHEFKTPISTISVAVETMLHPAVIGEREKMIRYTGVIQDENLRMKHHVDKILQMAVLEEGGLVLKRSTVDVHDVLSRALNNLAVQVEAKGGTITRALDASDTLVSADPVHFSNIVHNILDNALKYSVDAPLILVGTRTAAGWIHISIKDGGIGIRQEDQAKVFEKYYRVHTGNVHNVKGFGLGLSYVKLMVEAHSGTVKLSSVEGLGTTVEIGFPTIPAGGSAAR